MARAGTPHNVPKTAAPVARTCGLCGATRSPSKLARRKCKTCGNEMILCQKCLKEGAGDTCTPRKEQQEREREQHEQFKRSCELVGISPEYDNAEDIIKRLTCSICGERRETRYAQEEREDYGYPLAGRGSGIRRYTVDVPAGTFCPKCNPPKEPSVPKPRLPTSVWVVGAVMLVVAVAGLWELIRRFALLGV